MFLNEPIRPVKLFIAILRNFSYPKELILYPLELNWGEIDYESKDYPFDKTDYYQKEMGENLTRFFVSFKKIIPPHEISQIKKMTNAIESCYSANQNRGFNLDPGYIDFHKVVLASYKFGGQKIAIDQEIYADLTLYYHKGTYTSFPWTFPDFHDNRYYHDLLEIRRIYKNQIKNLDILEQ